MTEALTVKKLYTLDQTIAKDIFEGVTYPWEVLPKISSFILELGKTLSEDEYEKRGENVWIAKSAKVAPTAFINRTGDHWEGCRSPSLCIYPWKCDRRRGCCCRQFDRAEKCDLI